MVKHTRKNWKEWSVWQGVIGTRAQKLTSLNKIEKDIIVKHMFGATVAPPRYKESWIVTCVDKYWAVRGDPALAA